ncbi:family pyridoxal phosphate enzyme protein [Rutstroemia sp. NJR-2017a BVV2]|nr:family pyridoxal phosphate enzyme protein [Rutstroemia sp. NJR-2017a BVV2]
MTSTPNNNEMKLSFDPTRAKSLVSAFQSVSEKVTKAAAGRNVRLVAVSKLKPASDILALHREANVEHFGENYAQELMEKAEILPREIKWHFIGGLQSNKCKPLSSQIPNLHLVSSIDTPKKATQLSLGRSLLSPPAPPLLIHIQINTSGETSKSGVSPGPDATALCKHVLSECPNLKLAGLMTIGAIARSKEGGENEDFKVLREERDRLQEELGVDLELSMGMSNDFEEAVRQGSGEVRIGSTIFGERPPKEEFRVKEEVEEGKA